MDSIASLQDDVQRVATNEVKARLTAFCVRLRLWTSDYLGGVRGRAPRRGGDGRPGKESGLRLLRRFTPRNDTQGECYGRLLAD